MTPVSPASDPAGASSTPALLEFSEVSHRFGRRWVLRGVDLTVTSGDVVAVGGSNGAGKTTLLRMAATLLRPTRGQVRVHGADLGREGAAFRGRIGFMGHSPALYEDLTARENLLFAFRMRGGGPDREAAGLGLAEVGLEDHADVRVRKFSAGMRRRLALARVLTSDPELLLMDEPYASLDREGVALVNRVIMRVTGAGGAVVMATHDFLAGEGVTTRVVTLTDGRFDDPAVPADPPPRPPMGGA